MINRKDSSHVLSGSLLSEIQVLRVSMQRVSFHFAPRKYNRAAHIVEKKALSSLDRRLVDQRLFLISSL
ncbi:unnamed protein product [Linum trigynum]|uniref:RNase H type-1 domain-containing protein n=1 Tax=Linum trigynum TaxID=586398 RepID=A0AAV2CR01_9ROSI